jgi:membrane fusion protein (multidrug efflux system)
MKQQKLLLPAILTLAIIVLVSACKKPEADNEETIFAVNVTTAVRGNLSDYIEVNGDVKSNTEVQVYPDVSGKLSSINTRVGQKVKKNGIVAYVDPSKPGMNYAKSPVKSPISGTVTHIPGQVGSTVSQQSAIVHIGKMDDIEILTNIAEKFISRMDIGLPALLYFDAWPGEIFNAKISDLSPVVDPASRMMEVHLAPDTSSGKILPGMFAEIKIITQQKDDIIKIPTACIVLSYNQKLAYVVNEDNTVSKRILKVGIQIDDKSEIIEGINENEKVVILGQNLLENGAQVKIINEIDGLEIEDKIL